MSYRIKIFFADKTVIEHAGTRAECLAVHVHWKHSPERWWKFSDLHGADGSFECLRK